MPLLQRPADDEYAPFYQQYVTLATDAALRAVSDGRPAALSTLVAGLPDEQALRRYGPGKWSVKEVVGHVIDTERIMTYRALRVARGDAATPLAGFDENAFVATAGFDARPLADLLAEFGDVRRATGALFSRFDAAALGRRGTANGFSVTVRALAYIIAGHELHHTRLLRERYGLTAPTAS